MSVSHLHEGHLGQVVLKQQLIAVCGADHDVPLQPGVGDLAADVGIGGAHDHPVRGCCPCSCPGRKTLPSKEAGLSLALPAKIDLEPLEVGLALHDLDERHFDLLVFSKIQN
jgi:hypothetical protein